MSSTCFEPEGSSPRMLPRARYRAHSSTFKTAYTDELKRTITYLQVHPSSWR